MYSLAPPWRPDASEKFPIDSNPMLHSEKDHSNIPLLWFLTGDQKETVCGSKDTNTLRSLENL